MLKRNKYSTASCCTKTNFSANPYSVLSSWSVYFVYRRSVGGNTTAYRLSRSAVVLSQHSNRKNARLLRSEAVPIPSRQLFAGVSGSFHRRNCTNNAALLAFWPNEVVYRPTAETRPLPTSNLRENKRAKAKNSTTTETGVSCPFIRWFGKRKNCSSAWR